MRSMHPWMRTLLSLLLYIAVYYLLFRDIKSIALLVLVIVLHETGHYIAMRAFGYTNVRMLFLPMLGAFVSGKPAQVDPAKRLIVLFAGPLPGIVLGMISAMVYSRTSVHIYYQLALMFILLNLFNLIPVSPMDGGQILETLFPRSAKWIQTAVILLLAAVVIYWSLQKAGVVWLLLLLLLASRLFALWKYGDDRVPNETGPVEGPSWNERLIFLAVWLAAFIIPLQTLYRIII